MVLLNDKIFTIITTNFSIVLLTFICFRLLRGPCGLMLAVSHVLPFLLQKRQHQQQYSTNQQLMNNTNEKYLQHTT